LLSAPGKAGFTEPEATRGVGQPPRHDRPARDITVHQRGARASFSEKDAMADQKFLRTIGLGFSAITLVVTFVAMMSVADAVHTVHETAPVVASATQ
jgi:hypothetical protein